MLKWCSNLSRSRKTHSTKTFTNFTHSKAYNYEEKHYTDGCGFVGNIFCSPRYSTG